MLVVAGLSLKNLKPRVWDPDSPYYLPKLEAVMVSFADAHRMAPRQRAAMERGLHEYLGIPATIKIYLDNGAFSLLRREMEVPPSDYETFVERARPNWYPVPQDYIPMPSMSAKAQIACFERTMAVNRSYGGDGFVPVAHVGKHLPDYLKHIVGEDAFVRKKAIALGGIVPNLLRSSRAMPYEAIIENLIETRREAVGKELHVFGLGGTATLHLAALLSIDSLDSSGWRNRAARGLVQLPGSGDRLVAELGKWRGRRPDENEWVQLAACGCPACESFGLGGLQATGVDGFCNRATHNLWTLLEESEQIAVHLSQGTYDSWYSGHVKNSIYQPLIRYTLGRRNQLE